MKKELMSKMNPVIEEICDKCCPYAKAVNAGQMDEETFAAHCAGALDCPSLDLMDAVDEVVDAETARWQDAEMETHYDRLCASALHFGVDAQLRKTKEELIELIEVIDEELDGDEDEPRPDREHTLEEIADVYNMLDQLCILWDVEEPVQEIAESKMIRTLARIGAGTMKGEEN